MEGSLRVLYIENNTSKLPDVLLDTAAIASLTQGGPEQTSPSQVALGVTVDP